MRKLIIDTDPGIDDAMAIHLAFAHPRLELVGLTSVFGNVHVEKATRNALALVEMAGADTPVAGGADKPLMQPLHPPAYFVHGDEGFGTLSAFSPNRTADRRAAAEFLVETINAAPGEITLCPIAPLTNIALALRLDPSIASKVHEVVLMGGAFSVPGNVTPHAEANIWNDPHAAAKVFAADWPITMVGLDVTEDARCSPEDFAELAEAAPKIGGFLNDATQFYFEWHKSKPHFRHTPFDGCFLHDPSAVLAVDDPSPFQITETPITVVTEGDEIGRTIAHTEGRPVKVCTGVNAPEIRRRFLDTLFQADTVRESRQR